MHELGIVFHIVDKVMECVSREELSEVETIVLEVGDKSPVVPEYLTYCYPAAVDGTMLEQTELRIESVSGEGFFLKEIVAR